ncbi:MAG: hypothetical protein ACI4LP_01610 [Anaerovoracaceae bacterium]
MYTIIVCILLILMFWEVATWAVFFYLRRLAAKINDALERYINRRKDISLEICKYSDGVNTQEKKQYTIDISRLAKRQICDEMQKNIHDDFLMGEKTNKLASMLKSEKEYLNEDEDFFHLNNEFNELRQVIDGCIDYHNLCANKLEKMITTYPSKVVARLFRIKTLPMLKKA